MERATTGSQSAFLELPEAMSGLLKGCECGSLVEKFFIIWVLTTRDYFVFARH